jgi:CDP-glucose 4,6-dehydratase
VLVTTDKVYRDKGGEPWVESDPLGATDPYPVSKAAAEWVIADYHRTYFADRIGSGELEKRIGVGRAGNVLVGGDLYSSRTTDGAGRVFVDCYEALAAGQAPQIFRPGFTRPYIYGLDVIAGYMALMSRLDEEGMPGEGFNFGPLEVLGVPNGDLATRICDSWGEGPRWETGAARDEPFQAQSLDWSKAEERLAWRPAYTLEDAVRDTTRWYRPWSELGENPADGSLADLTADLLDTHRRAAQDAALAWAHQ